MSAEDISKTAAPLVQLSFLILARVHTHTHTQTPSPTYQQISLTEPHARLRTSKFTEATLARISSPTCGQICGKTNTRPINRRSNVHRGRSKQSQCGGGEKNRKKKQLSIERCLAATQAMMEWRGQFASAKHGADFVP